METNHTIVKVNSETEVECSCGEKHSFTKRAHQVFSELDSDFDKYTFSSVLKKFIYQPDLDPFLLTYGGLFH